MNFETTDETGLDRVFEARYREGHVCIARNIDNARGMHRQSIILVVAEEVLTEDFDRLAGLATLDVGFLGTGDWVFGVPLGKIDENFAALGEGVLAAELHRERRGCAYFLAGRGKHVLVHATARGLDLHILIS